MGRSIRVFLNPKSGTAQGTAGEIERLFAAAGCACVVHALIAGCDPAGLLRPGDIAVAAGGDGTVNAVINAVLKTGHDLGVLPVGTLNHFAHDLHLPLDLAGAVELIATQAAKPVDVAEVGDTYFVNNSSLGFYPAMVMDRERMKRGGWHKWPSLAVASVRAFVRFRCLDVELTLDGGVQHHRTPFFFVGNNEYRMDGSELGTRASLTGKQLFLYLAPGISRLDFLRLALAAPLGRLHAMPEFKQFAAESFTVYVRTRHRLRVSLDGEVRRMESPLRYRIHPGALRVIQPA